MSTTPMNRIIQHLRAVSERDGAGLSDGELLVRFLGNRDDAALATLVRRHGPMVWGVCCRLLSRHQDAEDAFQATFLVLIQKAAALPNKDTVGNWLYGVAHQTAIRMRSIVAKRGVRERQVSVMPEPATAEQYVWNDLQPILDEELSRLPDKYRALVVLCDLEGMTRKEVARQLGIPEGTAATRLAAARAMLAKRLTRRGVTISSVLLGGILSQQAVRASVPTTVFASTGNAAALVAAGKATVGPISPTVAALISGVTRAMLTSKLKSVLLVLLIIGLIVGAGVSLSIFHGSQAVGQQKETQETKPKESNPAPTDADIQVPQGVAQIGLAEGKVSIALVENKKVRAVRVSSKNAWVQREKLYIGDGKIAVKVDVTDAGVRLDNGMTSSEGWDFDKGGIIEVSAKQMPVSQLQTGDIYIVVPGIRFEVEPKK